MYRVIIADDKPFIREGLLKRNDWNAWGYEVAGVFEDGSDVLKLLEKEKADVLLTDICMFEVSGLEVARVISEKYPWMKVVLLSGYREFEYAQQALRCGVYDYLLKPIDYARLKEIFIKLKKEFDEAVHEEQVLRSFGEEEYGQLLELLKMVPDSMLGEGEDTWLAYARLKPFIHNAPLKVREIAVKRLLECLQDELSGKDERLAEEFTSRMRNIDISREQEAAEQISLLLQKLNDRLTQEGLAATGKAGHDEEMLKACRYISNHLSEDISYKDVADFVHLSPRHFLRRFSAETGESFTEYMIRMRICNAMKLLEDEAIPTGDICRLVGYKDEKYFQNLFKKRVGCTLGEYVSRKRRESIEK